MTFRVLVKQLTEDELFTLRCGDDPGLILKSGNALYYTKLDDYLDFQHVQLDHKTHLCGSCKRLSAKPECMGGCSKVHDMSIELYVNSYRKQNKVRSKKISLQLLKSSNKFKSLLKKAKRIEKYPFVSGFETFNVEPYNVLVVTECKNHEASELE